MRGFPAKPVFLCLVCGLHLFHLDGDLVNFAGETGPGFRAYGLNHRGGQVDADVCVISASPLNNRASRVHGPTRYGRPMTKLRIHSYQHAASGLRNINCDRLGGLEYNLLTDLVVLHDYVWAYRKRLS